MGNLTSNIMLALNLLIITFLAKGVFTATEQRAVIEYKPARLTAAEHRYVDDTVDGRRVLAPFQLCLDCRCCAANDTSNCSTMPCCFGIDCNMPDKPFGVCAFVPKTCNCTSCQ